mmetsp:Transcript_254/g.404  ORF Transcript_254/g.404 Transcript_254/m.404 type:complete len:742 (+) Transcript_254:110-2335(+)|eukprot:CAMPEP_0184869708 /NCGR_PEP_ID=MMETSP0580-20130426/35011_1 /TAXON_ID=1118495 /ORGANISM="Dactyliosolen fragilissimus" /LENGTH=741 /DNA_ID=CAMNT_0027371361 /DNA_START=42 /DNA_END=2267 /DNA_ORIENTATION=+
MIGDGDISISHEMSPKSQADVDWSKYNAWKEDAYDRDNQFLLEPDKSKVSLSSIPSPRTGKFFNKKQNSRTINSAASFPSSHSKKNVSKRNQQALSYTSPATPDDKKKIEVNINRSSEKNNSDKSRKFNREIKKSLSFQPLGTSKISKSLCSDINNNLKLKKNTLARSSSLKSSTRKKSRSIQSGPCEYPNGIDLLKRGTHELYQQSNKRDNSQQLINTTHQDNESKYFLKDALTSARTSENESFKQKMKRKIFQGQKRGSTTSSTQTDDSSLTECSEGISHSREDKSTNYNLIEEYTLQQQEKCSIDRFLFEDYGNDKDGRNVNIAVQSPKLVKIQKLKLKVSPRKNRLIDELKCNSYSEDNENVFQDYSRNSLRRSKSCTTECNKSLVNGKIAIGYDNFNILENSLVSTKSEGNSPSFTNSVGLDIDEKVSRQRKKNNSFVHSNHDSFHKPCNERSSEISQYSIVHRITNVVKIHVYDLLAAETLMQLPWGCEFPIGKCFGALNSGLHALGTGAYHCGVEVNGIEYAFGANNIQGLSGVFTCVPKRSPGYEFRTTLDFGERRLMKKCWINVPKDRNINTNVETGESMSTYALFSDSFDDRSQAYETNSKVTSVYQEREVFIDGNDLMMEMAREYMGVDYDLLRNNCCTFARDACLRLGIMETEIPRWFLNSAEAGANTEDAIASIEKAVTCPFQMSDDNAGEGDDMNHSVGEESYYDGFEIIADIHSYKMGLNVHVINC